NLKEINIMKDLNTKRAAKICLPDETRIWMCETWDKFNCYYLVEVLHHRSLQWRIIGQPLVHLASSLISTGKQVAVQGLAS
ncbi:hypothetical protein HAX54_035182, partial [Datura stramonium]|nr:hypothetical protein [Datura stramonium]